MRTTDTTVNLVHQRTVSDFIHSKKQHVWNSWNNAHDVVSYSIATKSMINKLVITIFSRGGSLSCENQEYNTTEEYNQRFYGVLLIIKFRLLNFIWRGYEGGEILSPTRILLYLWREVWQKCWGKWLLMVTRLCFLFTMEWYISLARVSLTKFFENTVRLSLLFIRKTTFKVKLLLLWLWSFLH